MVARKITYEGRVQGVGFRWTVRQLVKGFELRGMVKNLPDGRVELCVQGEKEEVSGFLQEIRDSDLAGHFTNEVEEVWSDVPTTLRGFQIEL